MRLIDDKFYNLPLIEQLDILQCYIEELNELYKKKLKELAKEHIAKF
jgi:hypothetical protein